MPARPTSNGPKCRQRFRLFYSYDTCRFDHQEVAQFRFVGGTVQQDIYVPFSNNSNNWCAVQPVSVPTPVIASVTPTTVTRGSAFTLVITGDHFQVSQPSIGLDVYSLFPSTVTNTRLTLEITPTFLQLHKGLIPVWVITSGGKSNVVYVNVTLQ